MKDELTPIRKQYLEIKKRYPQTIVFFRLGDFYETFDEDAEITSRELDLVLTSRNVARGTRIPMAGIPYHAVENYLARLIEKGYHVAICEQVGGQPAKGLFAREVVRVVTPGTLIEPGLLKNDSNNYLFSACLKEKTLGIAFADITTGEFLATQIAGDSAENTLNAEVTRLQPAEIIIPHSLSLKISERFHITRIEDSEYSESRSDEVLLEHFGVTTLAGFGLTAGSPAVRAAAAILRYLGKNQPACLPLLKGISTYTLDEFMVLDAATRRNLELTETLRAHDTQGSLLGVLDCTITPMGRRLIRQWVNRPLTDHEQIQARLNAVASLTENGLKRADLRAQLKPLNDLERLINRIVSGLAIPRDLVALRSSLEPVQRIIELTAQDMESVIELIPRLYPLKEIAAILAAGLAEEPPATLMNTGVIRKGYSAELDQVYFESAHARDWMANLESSERERTGIKNLKVSYNKVFGYYIEISKGNAAMAPDDYIRKQTLVNGERFITPEMKEYESLVLNAEDRIREIESQLFRQLCSDVGRYAAEVLSTARGLAMLDVLLALAETAAVNGYVKPEIHEGLEIEIIEGRHPVVEKTLQAGSRYVPNDTIMTQDAFIQIITGPNMSGKSTYLRQIALIILMAQMGSFVPARSARIGLVDRIFTRIGAQDEIHAGLSTFMVEMVEAANILNNAGPRSLLILDEIGRGTSTYDGLSIAWAILEYIHNLPTLRSRTLFATHYHELTVLPDTLPGMRNYNVAVTESDGNVVFLHKIIEGAADRSYGIHVAQIAGLPKPVISRANELMKRFEGDSELRLEVQEAPLMQLTLFPETNPIMDALRSIDVNSMSPIEAINQLYEWQKRFVAKPGKRSAVKKSSGSAES